MMKLLLTICFLWSQIAISSGSDTVFFKRINDFRVTDDLSTLRHPDVSRFLENTGRNILVVEINPEYLDGVKALLIDGNQVNIQFGMMPPIEFFYFEKVDLIIGESSDNSIFVLLPCYKRHKDDADELRRENVIVAQ